MYAWRCGLLVTVLIWSVLLSGCRQSAPPVTIGYVSALSGRAAGLGQEGRDAVLLAVEQFNRAGGLQGNPVQVQIRDHHGDAGEALSILRQFKQAGIVAVVGPMMSQMAVAMAPEADRLELPLISPTVSTEELSGKRDFFFRPHYSDHQAATYLAQLMAAEEIARVAIVQDLDNRSYVESWSEAFCRDFPGSVVLVPFHSSQDPVFAELVSELAGGSPQAVLILANAPDTGMIAQHMARKKIEVRKYATCWSASGPLVHYGGESVEGLEFLHSINHESDAADYVLFRQRFRERFDREPLFPAVHAYDTARILLETLTRRRDGESLQDALLRIRAFEGTQYPLVFSPTGDLERPPLFLTRITQAKFCFVCNVVTE